MTRPIIISVVLVAGVVCGPVTAQSPGEAQSFRIDTRTLPRTGTIDERFQSFQIGFSPITGGRKWRAVDTLKGPAASAHNVADVTSDTYEDRPPVDLKNPRLRKLAAALARSYIRYSGTSGNSLYFHDSDGPIPDQMREGGREILTREAWKGAIDFARSIDARILTSFAIDATVRDSSGTWTPVRAAPWLAYTRSIGGEIYAAEMFNEPNLSSFGHGPKDYDGAQFARDLAVFRAFASKDAPAMKIVGPGDTMMRGTIPGHPSAEQLMSGTPTPKFDIISYHYYGAVSTRCAPANAPQGTSPDQALTEEWLGRADASFQEHKRLRDRYAPGKPIWLTETGGAACGGSPWHATFLDTFRLMDQQARLAKQGLSASFVSALEGENYAWLDDGTFAPRPSYWAALLWRRLMGTGVLDAGPTKPDLHVYAHCLRGKPGGVTLLAINLKGSPAEILVNGPAKVYALTAPELQGKALLLNGKPLTLGHGDALPALTSRSEASGRIGLAPESITFITQPEARNGACPGG
ncbi:MAG: hypothetical protein KGM17_14815 [Sphingomonadales bacterium]|nr:hypothetical protein [Sphingomonadales bacterium]